MTNPTSNYGWVLPNSADLVTDLPADFDVALQGVDTRLKALQPGTTLGDLAYSSSTANTNTRLAVGSTGNVLTVAGGVPTWAAPSAGGANWSLLNAGGTALTGAQTITISGISGKDKLMILVDLASSANASSYIGIRFNGDTASNCYYYGSTISAPALYAASFLTSANENSETVYLGAMSASATSRVSGYLSVTGANTSGVKVFAGAGGASVGGSNTQIGYNIGGYYNSSSTISSVSVYSNSGNFDAGTVYVYASA